MRKTQLSSFALAVLAALSALAVSAVSAVSAAAQSDTTGAISGTVYDSIARAPLSGATVQMVDAAHPERLRSVTTDAKGRFTIDALTPGRYLIGFQHPSLDRFALDMPTRVVDVPEGRRVNADLATPSPATLNATICGASGAADSTGLVVGVLRDARSGNLADTGSVVGTWQEVVFEKSRLSVVDRETRATIGQSGWFGLCGVPSGVDVLARASHLADTTGFVVLRVEPAGIARHDLSFGGTATVRGVVRTEKDRPLANARVAIAGVERAVVSDSSGTFWLGGIPAGSQSVEVRAIGYVPDVRELELAPDTVVEFTAKLTSVKRVLDTVRIVATRLYNRDSNGFQRRKRMGFGTFFDQEDIERRHPYDLYSLMYTAPSVRVVQRGFDRSIVMRSTMGTCSPSVFLDGQRMSGFSSSDLDLLVRPDEVAGLEIYRPIDTPAEFTDFNGCGAVVIWTKPPLPRPKKAQ